MGHVATPEGLAVRWAEVMRDPSLRDLPYKIELNERGKIEISPASNRHALLQAHLAAEFAKHLPASRRFRALPRYASQSSLRRIPTTRSRRRPAPILPAGAHEVWMVSEDGSIAYHRSAGRQPDSAFGIRISMPG